jgi:ubiquinone/menaquinone biosynthesis C-methylase UbiE
MLLRPKNWDDHVEHLAEMAQSPGFRRLRDLIVEQAQPSPAQTVVDVGAGTGLLALHIAPMVARVVAVDISRPMCAYLEERAATLGFDNVDVLCASAHELPLPARSVDLVVSNYCFHHLSDADKRRALRQAFDVLRPGGRLVLGDMMFRLTLTTARDRTVVVALIGKLLRKGPGGIVRIVKNALRWLTGHWEHPADVSWWEHALATAGFTDVRVEALEHEGGIAVATRPPAPAV